MEIRYINLDLTYLIPLQRSCSFTENMDGIYTTVMLDIVHYSRYIWHT